MSAVVAILLVFVLLAVVGVGVVLLRGQRRLGGSAPNPRDQFTVPGLDVADEPPEHRIREPAQAEAEIAGARQEADRLRAPRP